MNGRIQEAEAPIPNAHRIYTYLTMAMYDATIAAWESKYFYNRPRPSAARQDAANKAAGPEEPILPIGTCGSRWCSRRVAGLLLP